LVYEPTRKLRATAREDRKEDDEIQKTPKHFAPESAALQPEEVEEPDPFPLRLSPEQQETPNVDNVA